MLGKIESRRRQGRQWMRWLDGVIDSMHMSLRKLRKTVKNKGSLACFNPWGYKESNMTEQQNNYKNIPTGIMKK